MKRLLLALAALAAVLASPTPAGAEADDVCSGLGRMTLAAPITYTFASSDPPPTTSWYLGFTTQVCLLTEGMLATGAYTGWCDFGTGYGVAKTGNRFAFVSLGQKLLYTGGLVGQSPFVVDPLVFGNSCYSGATHFLVGWGGAVLWDCKVMDTSGTVVDPPLIGVPIHHRECV